MTPADSRPVDLARLKALAETFLDMLHAKRDVLAARFERRGGVVSGEQFVVADDLVKSAEYRALRDALLAAAAPAGNPMSETTVRPIAFMTEERLREFLPRADAILAAAAPSREPTPTCATCRFWRRMARDSPEDIPSTLGKCRQFITGPHSIQNLTQQSFGCNQHEPLPPAPAPGDERQETGVNYKQMPEKAENSDG